MGSEVGALAGEEHCGPRAPEDQTEHAGETGLRQQHLRASALCVCVVPIRVLLINQSVCEVGGSLTRRLQK